VRWLPFQLNPDLPESGISRTEYFQRKFGSPTHSYARVAAVGGAAYLAYALAAGSGAAGCICPGCTLLPREFSARRAPPGRSSASCWSATGPCGG